MLCPQILKYLDKHHRGVKKAVDFSFEDYFCVQLTALGARRTQRGQRPRTCLSLTC